MSLVITTMTLTVLPTKCKRVFRKMKSMKAMICSTMSDIRLRDLWILVVESNFNISFEKRKDDFANLHRKLEF